ncbi:MAG: hypothetical protein E5X77_03715 [Mesorhizobium sp.]|nr:MAG: hypothetical protein E5X77_03715 [Mesorhizobium sp.]
MLDDLSTHTPAALYQTLPTSEGRFTRLEFPLHPMHASWLNMADIEVSVLRSQCRDRRTES